jgi:hypothetical protein
MTLVAGLTGASTMMKKSKPRGCGWKAEMDGEDDRPQVAYDFQARRPSCSAHSTVKENVTEPARNKISIKLKLDTMVVNRLFGNDVWLVGYEESAALMRALEELGLEERLPADPLTWYCTPLGKELHLDLHMAFMGLLCEWEIILHLEKYNLMFEEEADAILDLLGMDNYPVSELKCRVRRAYCEHNRLSRLRH